MSLVPLVLLGLSYTIYAVVLWGSLPYMVEARVLGTAFGICTTFQNLGTVIAPPVLAYFLGEKTKSFIYADIFFLVNSLLALMFNLLIYCYDKSNRDNLLQSKEPLARFEAYTEIKINA